MIGRLIGDLRHAFRVIRRAPAFTLLVILTIAVGVGASTAMFSVVDAVLLRPLPFPDSGALLLVGQYDLRTGQGYNDASPANFLDWQARSRSFAGMAAFRDWPFTATLGDHPERLRGAIVNASFFDVLGTSAAVGRTFQLGDEGSGGARVAVIGAGLWRERFGGRPDVVGRTIRLDGALYTIVGVLPPGIDYPDDAEVWVAPRWRVPDDPRLLGQDPSAERDHGYLFAIARLRPGVTREAAQAEMSTIAAALAKEFPDSDGTTGVRLTRLRDDLVGDVRPTLRLLFAAVGLLLLVAVANVSGLLLARAASRRQEIAVRMALGAGRGRIVAQLLVESALLGLAGGGAGLLLAMWLTGPLLALSPRDLHVTDMHLDATILLFGIAVSVGAGLLFGIAPARQALHTDLHDDLKHSSRGLTRTGDRRARATLVGAEMALSLVLLVAAGLTLKSLILLQRVPTGFEPDGALAFTLGLPTARYANPTLQADFFDRVLAAVRAVPGVRAAGATSRLPLSPGNSIRGLDVDGRAPTTPVEADYRAVSPGYFRALGIPLERGRDFTDADAADRPEVAIVSRSMAQWLWPGDNPLGHTIAVETGHPITVVGVVGDVHHASLAAAPAPTFYMPYRQDPWASMTIALRTTLPPAALARAIRQAVSTVDRDEPVGAVTTMDERLSGSLSRRRFTVTLLSIFGAVALGLAAVGLYGVLAFVVAQGRREIGVRIALGARPVALVAGILGQGLRLAGLGIAVGLALALGTSRLLASALYGVGAVDASTFVGVSGLLLAIAALASLVPALRASRVDPLIALRDE
jgi:predicted permease